MRRRSCVGGVTDVTYGRLMLCVRGIVLPEREAELVRAAVEEAAASSGWCEVIGDWRADEPAVPLPLLPGVKRCRHCWTSW
ncbi:hypothetical protein ACFVRD_02305 [Streptomyces sp. NPDC057908]|uniref:hypothetical protein n=1 Tax=Streptomyces sp. NPDC057908 TaxID=3346276 RepID=UPI0036EC0A3C